MNAAQNLLPSDDEAAVLGILLMDGAAISTVKDMLVVDDFQKPEHRVIYAGMLSLAAAGNPINATSLGNELHDRMDAAGGVFYWSTLTLECPPAIHLLYHVEQVQEVSQRVKLHRVMEQAQKIRDPEQAMERLQEGLREVESVRRRVDWDDRQEATQKLVEWVTIAPTEDARGIPTGLPTLDAYLNGLRKKNLITVVARTSVGKSSFAVTVTYNVGYVQQKPVLFFSAEMDKEEIRQKLASIATGVAWARIDNHELSEIEEKRVVKKILEMESAPIFVLECAGWTTSEIVRWTKVVNTAYPLALVVVDYLQFVHTPKKTDSRVQEVSAVARELKEMAMDLELPVMAPAQLNRMSEHRADPEPMLSDIRESGEIEQTSNVVILLWKDREEQDNDPPPVETVYVKVGKNRMGRKGKFALGFRGAQMEFVELERANDPF